MVNTVTISTKEYNNLMECKKIIEHSAEVYRVDLYYDNKYLKDSKIENVYFRNSDDLKLEHKKLEKDYSKLQDRISEKESKINLNEEKIHRLKNEIERLEHTISELKKSKKRWW